MLSDLVRLVTDEAGISVGNSVQRDFIVDMPDCTRLNVQDAVAVHGEGASNASVAEQRRRLCWTLPGCIRPASQRHWFVWLP